MEGTKERTISHGVHTPKQTNPAYLYFYDHINRGRGLANSGGFEPVQPDTDLLPSQLNTTSTHRERRCLLVGGNYNPVQLLQFGTDLLDSTVWTVQNSAAAAA